MKTAERIQLANCIVMDEHGGVLVVHRKTPRRTHWEIPGGKVEPGETAEAAAVRELREELGVDVVVERRLGARDCDDGEYKLTATWFLARITNGEPRLQEPEFDKWGFLEPVTLTCRYDELSVGLKMFLEAIAYGEIDLQI